MLRISRRVEAAPEAAPQDSDDEEMERILEMESILYAAGEGRLVEAAHQAQGMEAAPQELLELEIDLGRESSDSDDE